MQAQGQFRAGELGAVLSNAEQERITGVMTLTPRGTSQPNATCDFLFGHLLHASSGNRQGTEVVLSALHWPAGEFNFDPRGMLHPERTISARTEQLIEAAAKGLHTPEGTQRGFATWQLG